ncbi:MAG: hypothetical protein PHD31_00610 [Candidatus Pacebacteria bacterium]|nr:hypothetical protein [Candidatus Paceibacterota bacterium]
MKTGKLIKTIYLYVVSLISLIFLAVGIGNFINTSIKSSFFKEAEKRDYSFCNNQPYFTSVADINKLKESPAATEDDKQKITTLISEYENWKAQNIGEECYKSERAKRMVDSLTMLLIALPLYLFHWSMARKEKQED